MSEEIDYHKLAQKDDHKYLLYKAYDQFRHKDCTFCHTWRDGCNCIIPYDVFDNDFYRGMLDYLENLF